MRKFIRYIQSFEDLSKALYAVLLGGILMALTAIILWFMPGVEFFPN